MEALGEFTIIYVDCGFQAPIIAKLSGNLNISKGDCVHLNAEPQNMHLFDPNGKIYKRRSGINVSDTI